MHKLSFRIAALGLICLIAIPMVASGSDYKWLRVGRLHNKMVDSGDQGESAGEGTFLYYYDDGWYRYMFDHAGMQMGAKVDGELIISGYGHGNSNELVLTIPVKDENEITVHKYLRYQPPKITVNGIPLDAPYPINPESDHVDPDKLPGTADGMVESWYTTNMGLKVHQRMLAFAQHNHDDYLIYEWTFTNTGDVDTDYNGEVDATNKTIEDWYLFRAINWVTGYSRNWISNYGFMAGDTIRMNYAYPARTSGSGTDDTGAPRSDGWLRRHHYVGEAILHVDTAPGDNTDDFTQPRNTGYHTAENTFWKMNATLTSSAAHDKLYKLMSEGHEIVFGADPEIDPALTTRPEGSHHLVPLDQRGYETYMDIPWWNWRPVSTYVIGPYDFAVGDSLTIVWAMVGASLDPTLGYRVGAAWNDKTAGDLWKAHTGDADWVLEPPWIDNPLMADLTDNDRGKDSFIFSLRDSLFMNAWAAKFAYENNYDVPAPPPAPNLAVTGLPGKINIKWDYDGIPHDKNIAGFRVYRTLYATTVDTGWVKVFDTADDGLVYEWDDDDPDTGPERGQDYYYFVTAYDDGINDVGVFGTSQVLESSWHQNRTSIPASLTREPESDLSKIVVVPNPFNLSARDLQYVGAPDKIMFLNLPPECTIMIYSESGDLIRTLEHTDGSGDEPWGVIAEEQSTSDYGQIIVSGLYIAYIETPGGDSHYLKFVIVR